MRKKFNPELLKEEQNRFKNLLEYDFYQERKDPVTDFKKDIILGDLEEAEDEPTDDVAAGAANVAADLGVDSPGEETTADIPEPEETPADEEMPSDDEMDLGAEEPAEELAGDEVEVDVTSLVKGAEEAKKSADMANKNTEMLLQKLTDLEGRIASMDAITNKIEGLEKEIIKRNPTPVEKLEMRSLSSYPFNQKLSDYWADKEGKYDVMGKQKKEYVLTKDDVDADYSESNIKKSFSSQDSPYEIEDIEDYTEEDM